MNINDLMMFTFNIWGNLMFILLILGFLLIGGLPPFLLFFLKLKVYFLLYIESFDILIIFLLYLTLVSIFYYIRLIRMIVFQNNKWKISDKYIIDSYNNGLLIMSLYFVLEINIGETSWENISFYFYFLEWLKAVQRTNK